MYFIRLTTYVKSTTVLGEDMHEQGREMKRATIILSKVNGGKIEGIIVGVSGIL